jgi:hypothetical protein
VSETEAIFDSVFDSDLSDAETIDLIVDVLEDGLTAENLGAALGAVFDEAVSTEVLIETFTAVLGNELNEESLSVIVDVLESDTITEEQVSQVVTLVIDQEGGIPSDQATELATSSKVLESIDGEQATEVFAAIVVAEVTQEAGAAIAEALINAVVEVKESFEEEINVFDGVFDTYVATGSVVDVGTRRSLVAATAALSTIAAAGAAMAATSSPQTPGGTQGGSSGPSAPSASGSNEAVRREEEEPGGEIAGPEDRDDEELSRNSIYIYNQDNTRRFSIMGFIKKFAKELAGLSFTLAGSVVVYVTLSGTTQRIALVATTVALVVHITNAMLSNDQD